MFTKWAIHKQHGASGLSMSSTSPSSPPPCEVSKGMDVTLSPSYSITPFIFGFLKSIDLQLVDLMIDSLVHFLPFVNSSQKTLGEEIVVYDSVMTKSREVGNESLSTDEFLGCDNVVDENLEESILNDELVGEIDVDDSYDSEPILQFKRTKPTMKLVEPPLAA